MCAENPHFIFGDAQSVRPSARGKMVHAELECYGRRKLTEALRAGERRPECESALCVLDPSSTFSCCALSAISAVFVCRV